MLVPWLLLACAEDTPGDERQGDDGGGRDFGGNDAESRDGEGRDALADGAGPASDAIVSDAVAGDAAVGDGPLASDLGSDGFAPVDGAPAPGGCLDAVIRVSGVEIFQYEASRADATGASAGIAGGGACSRPGVLPWTFLTIAEARAACVASGFSLCDGPSWQRVCTGDPPTRPWPYGDSFRAGLCNEHINGAGQVEVTGHRPECRTPDGVFDQSGNVWEFTDEGDKRGASFKLNATMFRQEVTSCLQTYSVIASFADDDVGFRCCRRAD